MRLKQGKWEMLVVYLALVFVVSTSGCEPLRKKFTRQKKESQIQETQPILEPIEYPSKVEDAMSLLKHHYGLWGIWYNQTLQDMAERSSDKRILYDLGQLSLQLEGLKKLFPDDVKKKLSDFAVQIDSMRSNYLRPEGVRRSSIILQNDLRRMDKDFRKNFHPDVVKDLLSK